MWFIQQEAPRFLVEDFSSSLGPLFCAYEVFSLLISSSSKSWCFFEIVSFFCLFAKLSPPQKSVASFSQLFIYIHFCIKAPLQSFSGACFFFRVISPFIFVSSFSILITLVFGQNWEILVGLIWDTELPMFFGWKFSVVCDCCFPRRKTFGLVLNASSKHRFVFKSFSILCPFANFCPHKSVARFCLPFKKLHFPSKT